MKKYIDLKTESARCLLCKDAKCSMACPENTDPARMIRAIRFDNKDYASSFIDKDKCKNCKGFCEEACVHFDKPIRIKEIIDTLPENNACPDYNNLKTTFLGVECENPFFLSSSVVASSYKMCAQALKMGWAGLVYKTIGIFTPKEVSPRFDAVTKECTDFIGFKNLEQIAEHPLAQNLADLKKLKQNFPTKVIVSSIMGQTDEEWAKLAKLSEEAGCDMIECNFSCPHMSAHGLGSDVGQNPELVEKYVEIVKSATKLPVIAKMTPNISHMEIPAIAAVTGGADALAAINTIKSISGIDLDNMSSMPDINGKSSVSGYSGKAVKPIALRFIYDMASCKELNGTPISGMGGIETWRDAADFIALGCSNLQITTAVMQYGYRIIDDLKLGLSMFLKKNNYKSVSELTGVAIKNIVPTDKLDRTTVVYPSFNKSTCVSCKRCEVSCSDAGHDAITFKNDYPSLDAKKCVGCHLCRLVCPTDSIGTLKRVSKPIRSKEVMGNADIFVKAMC